MKFSFIQVLIQLFLVTGALACKQNTSSDLDHNFGETRVEPGELRDCNENLRNYQDYQAKNFAKSSAYIKQVASYIMQNNPNTFTGPYSPKSFCFSIVPDPRFNASAISATRMVKFNTGALMKLKSDAEVAAIMAHELAHITMNHSGEFTHSDMKKLGSQAQDMLQQNSEYHLKSEKLGRKLNSLGYEIAQLAESVQQSSPTDRKAIKNIKALEMILNENNRLKDLSPSQWSNLQQKMGSYYDQIMGGSDAEAGVTLVHKIKEMTQLEQEFEVLSETLYQSEDEFYRIAKEKLGSSEQIANGKEREADEVGYELYLRSGLKPSEFLVATQNTVRMNPNEQKILKDLPFLYCLKMSFAAGRIEPERGTGSHPTGCWRLYNIAGNESEAHKEDYARFMNNTRVSIPGAVSLAEAREEISKYNATANDCSNDVHGERCPSEPPQTKEISQDEAEKQFKEANALKKSMCIELGGQWDSESNFGEGYCSLTSLVTAEEKRAYCTKLDGFWFSDRCECLPISWKNLKIDPQTCSIQSQHDQPKTIQR